MGLLDKLKNGLAPYDDEEDYEEEEIPARDEGRRGEPDGVIHPNSYTRVKPISATAKLQLVLIKPSNFNDAPGIADYLLQGNAVVANFDSTEAGLTRRMLDFLSGVAYANDGKVKKVADKTYIITPKNVSLQDDLLDELKDSEERF